VEPSRVWDANAQDASLSTLFEELYTRHYRDVFRYCLVLTRDRNDAEDIAAEAFVRAWGAWRRGREPSGQPLTWLLVIARHLATDRWRRLGRSLGLRAPAAPAASEHEVEALMWLEAVTRILTSRQREAIALRYHRDLTDAEIGQVMGLSESGVRSLVARALAVLRNHPEVLR
jgi:RNA polymerase sigma-70 factor (ECF subfamily)